MIKSRAPTRIDLAGGTLDIFPLYLFHEEGLTVNVAVDLYTEAELEARKDREIHITSKDQNVAVKFASLDEIKHDHKLSLFSRAVYFFKPSTGVNLTVKSSAPKGSGLGGSSSMLISTCGALDKLMNTNYSKKQLMDIAQGIETTVLQIPTGRQDYKAAMYGGFNAIHFKTAWNEVESLKLSKKFVSELKDSLILCYTGESHYSGFTNWDMFKLRVDRNPESIKALEGIKKTAYKMRGVLLNENLHEVGDALLEEWNNRIKLSSAVCTKQMAKLINTAKEKGAYAWKVCGAGGGGCMIFLANKKDRVAVEYVLKKNGAQILKYNFDFEGLKIEDI